MFAVSTTDTELSQFYLVDLPGYGFAKISKSVRVQWAPLIEDYFINRTSLLGVVVLVESRVVTEQDQQTLEWLCSIGHRPIVVATKVDKLKPSERVRTLRQVCTELGLPAAENLIPYSSMTGEGKDRLWGVLRDWAKT